MQMVVTFIGYGSLSVICGNETGRKLYQKYRELSLREKKDYENVFNFDII